MTRLFFTVQVCLINLRICAGSSECINFSEDFYFLMDFKDEEIEIKHEPLEPEVTEVVSRKYQDYGI